MKKSFSRIRIVIPSLFVLLFVLNANSFAQPETYKLFAGKWTTGAREDNAISWGNNFVRASLLIYDLDGILYVRMESPDADIFNVSSDDVNVDGNKIKIYFKQIDGLFKAELNDNKNVINGTLAFAGKHLSVSFVKVKVE
jgi:hypothetical protein